ncbi:uncharacterized protein LOC108630928 isoform X2 [Ceratina calcarata]|nr:uncharacterized protein LOC108630928 isoform X2 [Ceratina calcarata]
MVPQRASGFEKCSSEPESLEKDRPNWRKEREKLVAQESGSSDSVRGSDDGLEANEANEQPNLPKTTPDNFIKELCAKVPSSGRQERDDEVIGNGETDSCDGLTNGKKMAPVLGVPPPPPPAPHMGPDGLILPRKPYNPYLTSSNHKDLRRELLFNQKVGKNVLNQKSELQRALEKHREAVSRKEAERNREENFKDDPRSALQRAIEQRAKHIEMTLEQSQPTTEPPSNLLITARAKLRPRTDSQ